ncbi:MAG: hypothetical protein AAF968_24435 [Pseudomonadota bacterium]
MTRWSPSLPISDWRDEDHRQVIALMRTTYLEFCRGALHPELDGDDAATSALRRACREMGIPWISWQADRAMAGLFNLFYLHSVGRRVSAVRFVELARESDRAYAGEDICRLARFRASQGWTPIVGDHVSSRFH